MDFTDVYCVNLSRRRNTRDVGPRSLRGLGAVKRRWTRSAGIIEVGSRFVVNMLFDRPSPERKGDA